MGRDADLRLPLRREVRGGRCESMADQSHDWALIIGIDRYKLPIMSLKTAARCAEELARALETDHHFGRVILLRDEEATRPRIDRALEELEQPGTLGPEDRLLIYFAGHGLGPIDDADPCAGYLLPQDADRDRPVETFLEMGTLRNRLCSLPCRHLLVILDCCFAGAFRPTATRDVVRRNPPELSRERFRYLLTSKSRRLITSTSNEEKALDTIRGIPLWSRDTDAATGDLSPFTDALLGGLRGAADSRVPLRWPDGDGVITPHELIVYLQNRISSQVNQSAQLWELPGHGNGEFLFFAPGGSFREEGLAAAIELNVDNDPYQALGRAWAGTPALPACG